MAATCSFLLDRARAGAPAVKTLPASKRLNSLLLMGEWVIAWRQAL